jgi:glycosyltransferase involved in cell wall biosynthesis
MVARLIKDKGIGEYIEAAKILLNKSLKIKFQILGKVQESINSNFSKKHIDSLHESGVIEYLGESDDVKKYIISADCVVLPSYREGTSKALLEGHAMGRPLIASNVSGCKEIILHNKSGLLCEAKDSLDLASKMLQMTKKSRSERKKMGILGREKVKNEFSEEIVFSKMSKLISTII